MNLSIIVATHGADEWAELAHRRALPSANAQDAHEVIDIHLPLGTLASARNAAAAWATGDFLCFLDADDELAPGYRDAMYVADSFFASMPDGIPKLFVPSVQYVREVDRTPIGGVWFAEEPVVLNDGRPLHVVNRAVIGTLVPRELFWAVGGFADLATLEDWQLWLRCERAGAELVDVAAAVYRAFVRPGSRNADQTLYWQIRREFEEAA